MYIRHSLATALLAAALGGLILPAFAQAPDRARGARDPMTRGMGSRDRGDHGMMSHNEMSGGMMGGGCAGMMQSINGGDGRPNSQWRARPSDRASSE